MHEDKTLGDACGPGSTLQPSVSDPIPIAERLPIVAWNGKWAIRPTHEAADAFWAYWRENGETHKHGYYESTWGAINRALRASTPGEKP